MKLIPLTILAVASSLVSDFAACLQDAGEKNGGAIVEEGLPETKEEEQDAKEQLDALKRIVNEEQVFALEETNPLPGQEAVRTEMAEVVFVFRNVTKENKNNKDKNAILLKHSLKIALDKFNDTRNDKNLVNKNLWIQLETEPKTEKAKKEVISKVFLSVESTNIHVDIENEKIVLKVKFPKDTELQYDNSYRIVLSSKLLDKTLVKTIPGISHWSFETESKPQDPGAATEIEVPKIQVFGVGVYLLDLADIDIRKGIFHADMQLFLLKYYLDFEDHETAIREAMHENRTCKDLHHGEKFQFLQNLSKEKLLTKLNFINTVSKPVPEINFAKEGEQVFDHYRMRAAWRFSPQLEGYPFQEQQLPIQFELAGQSVTRDPDAVLCSLETFSGFAQNLSSLDLDSAMAHIKSDITFTSRFQIQERRNWPPLEGNFLPPYRFPHNYHVSRQPTRISSRLSWIVTIHRPPMIGLLELAPALFVSTSAIISYALPIKEFRTRVTTCTTALLAAVVQHSSIRNRIPERSAITIADMVMLVVYLLIIMAIFATVIIATLQSHRAYHEQAERSNTIIRVFGFLSPMLFLSFLLGDPRSLGTWVLNICTIFILASAILRGSFTTCFSCCISRLSYQKSSERNTYERLTFSNGRNDDELFPNDWSVVDVATWVESLKIPHSTSLDRKNYADLFFHQRIDGTLLSKLDVDMIKGFGIPLGHALRIHTEISSLLDSANNNNNTHFNHGNENEQLPDEFEINDVQQVELTALR